MPKVLQPKREDGLSQQMENMKSRLGDGKRNCHWARRFSKPRLGMVVVAPTSSSENSGEMEESQHVLPTRICIPWFILKAQNHLQVLASADVHREYWLIWTHLSQIPRKQNIRNSKFFLRSRGGGGKENLNLDIILVEMWLSRNFWQSQKRSLSELFYCLSTVFREKNNHACNHFLELSWFFSNLNSNVVLCRLSL